MSKVKKDKIEAQGFSIEVYTEDYMNDYISLTDIAKYKNEDDPRFVIQNWMRNRNTLEFIGFWEILNNENFDRVQFDTFKMESGLISQDIPSVEAELFTRWASYCGIHEPD